MITASAVLTFEDIQRNLHTMEQLLAAYPVIGSLVILMILDVISGLAVAVGTKSVSSTISWRGMCKKTVMLVLLGAASTVEPFANGLPLGKMVAMCFIVTEALSIAENAGALGAPMPTIFTETLTKLKADAEARRIVASGTAPQVVEAAKVATEATKAATEATKAATEATKVATVATQEATKSLNKTQVLRAGLIVLILAFSTGCTTGPLSKVKRTYGGSYTSASGATWQGGVTLEPATTHDK